MVPHTIDLRNSKSASASAPKTEKIDIPSKVEPREKNRAALTVTSEKNQESIAWSCYEYPQRLGGSLRFIVSGFFLAIGMGLGILTKDYLFIIFLMLAAVVLAVQMRKPPKILSFVINATGVQIGTKKYDVTMLKSFWIFEQFNPPELSLETTRPLSPFVHIPLSNVDRQQVRVVVGNIVPEEQHKELASHQIARILGF